MRSYFSIVFIMLMIVVFMMIPITHQVQAQTIPVGAGTYDPKDVCFDTLGYIPRTSPPENVTSTTDGFYMSSFEPLPKSSGYLPFPLFVSALSLAYNSTPILSYPDQHLTLEISMITLGEWMMGTLADWNQTVSSSSSTDAPVGLGQLKFVLATDSKVTRTFIYRMWERNIPGFTSPWEVPATVLANTNITFVTTNDEVIAALESASGSQGLVGLIPVIWAHKFPSFSVSITNERGDLPVTPGSLAEVPPHRISLVLDYTLAIPQLPDVANRINFNFTFTVIEGAVAVYPLIGTMFENVPRVTTDCASPLTFTRVLASIISINNIFGQRRLDTHILIWNMALFSVPMQVFLLADSLNIQPCFAGATGANLMVGSDQVSTLMYNYNLKYTSIGEMISQYLPYGSTLAVTMATTRVARLGVSELPLTAAQMTANPTFSGALLTSFGVAITVNLPGIQNFFLPRCKIASVLNGTIKYWSDLQEFNRATPLPHTPINIILTTAPSGLYSVFTRSLREIDAFCNGGTSDVTVTSTWNLNITTSFPNERETLDAHRITPYSISITSGPSIATDTVIQEAYLLNTTDYTISSSNAADVEAALSKGKIINEATGEVDLSGTATGSGHAFVGLSYFIMETSGAASANCGPILQTLKMLYWILTSDLAKSIAKENGYVPIPEHLAQNGIEKVRTSTCANSLVFPHLIHNTTELDLKPIIGGSVAGFVVLASVLAFVIWYLATKGQRNAKHAPKDDKTPFALIFTDIQSSTTLWSVAPQAMAASLDLHNEIIDRNIEYFEGYKVKTIGDAYMICVNDIKKAHEMCLSIQRDLYNAEWPSDEIDMAYADLFQDEECSYQVYNPDGSEITYKSRRKLDSYHTELYNNRTNPSLFHGVSIRIGMTWGCAVPKIDPVTNAYDYFGPTVNLASRCEACGNGGQTLYSAHAIDALRDAGVDLTDINTLAVRALGKQNLKGIPAPVELYQVLPVELGGRLFPPLRLDKDGAMTNELETATETETSQFDKTATMNSSGAGFSVNSRHSQATNKYQASSQRSQDPSHTAGTAGTTGDNSAASTNGGGGAQTGSSSLDEDDTSPKDFQFAKFLSNQTRIDPRLLLLVYDVIRSLTAATPNEKIRRQMIDTLAKDWRCQDFKTKHHLHFKKELGYEEYWTLRIASKCFGQASLRQRKRDPRHEFKLNLMRRGAIRVDDLDIHGLAGTSSATTDGASGTSGTVGASGTVFDTSVNRIMGSNASVGDGDLPHGHNGGGSGIGIPSGGSSGGANAQMEMGGGGPLAVMSVATAASSASSRNNSIHNSYNNSNNSAAVYSRNAAMNAVAFPQNQIYQQNHNNNSEQQQHGSTPPSFHTQQHQHLSNSSMNSSSHNHPQDAGNV